MPRSFGIQLQNPDRSHCRWIGTSELQDMQKREEVHVFTKGKKGNIIARLKPRVEALRSIHEASKSSITHHDILTNVGLDSRPHRLDLVSAGRRLAVQAKIAAFGKGAFAGSVPLP